MAKSPLPRPRTPLQKPQGLALLVARAESLQAKGDLAGAIRCYQDWVRDSKSPNRWVGHFNLGGLLRASGDLPGAIEAYQAALVISPKTPTIRINLGVALERLGRAEEALLEWRTALDHLDSLKAPDSLLLCNVLNNLGAGLDKQGRSAEAEQALSRSLSLNPHQALVVHDWIDLRRKLCLWPLIAALPGLPAEAQLNLASSLSMLSFTDDLEMQRAAALRQVATSPSGLPPLAPAEGYQHERLRIGYLSSNFGMHAISILTAELFELHDRKRVECWGFCWTPDERTEMRDRVIGAFEHFLQIRDLSDEDAAQAIRAAEIDILIDLQGLSSGWRPGILARRPAPVQITYLGFPGTTAIREIDYVLADRYIIPEESAQAYTETPLYLPNCFQANDTKRFATATLPRAAYHLPEKGFIFCAFNATHKISPELFEAWMRILARTPGSVLWIFADSPLTIANLTGYAASRGISGDRLVFAPKCNLADYYGRFPAADLFLDSFPFNGGTTAADALAMGLPILTLSGRSFASRMAGSLLRAVGMDDLITRSFQEYEDLAVRLASDPALVPNLKARLKANLKTYPLFDSPKFTRDLEDLLESVAIRPSPAPESPATRKPARKKKAIASVRRPRPFLIAAPAFDGRSAGITVLHTLCNELNRCGREAYLIFYEFKPDGTTAFYTAEGPAGFSPAHDLIRKLPASQTVQKTFRELLDTSIVIYPEVMQGNPLGAPRVVRYVLANPAHDGYPMLQGPTDFILGFDASYWEAPDHILPLGVPDPVFNDLDTLPATGRTMDCTYIGKGQRFGPCFKIPGSVLIERTWPSDKEGLAIMLRNTRYFYNWDLNTQTTLDAILCGAIPVFLRLPPFTPAVFNTIHGPLPHAEFHVQGSSLHVDLDFTQYQETRRNYLAKYRSSLENTTATVSTMAAAVEAFFT